MIERSNRFLQSAISAHPHRRPGPHDIGPVQSAQLMEKSSGIPSRKVGEETIKIPITRPQKINRYTEKPEYYLFVLKLKRSQVNLRLDIDVLSDPLRTLDQLKSLLSLLLLLIRGDFNRRLLLNTTGTLCFLAST